MLWPDEDASLKLQRHQQPPPGHLQSEMAAAHKEWHSHLSLGSSITTSLAAECYLGFGFPLFEEKKRRVICRLEGGGPK